MWIGSDHIVIHHAKSKRNFGNITFGLWSPVQTWMTNIGVHGNCILAHSFHSPTHSTKGASDVEVLMFECVTNSSVCVAVLLSQGDITKLKDAMNKHGNSIVHHIAGAVATNDLWKYYVDDYLAHLAGMAENRDSFQGCCQAVGNVAFTDTSLSSFVDMLEALPTFREALRKNATLELEEQMKTKFDELLVQCNHMRGQGVGGYLKCLELLQKALQCACCLWPEASEHTDALRIVSEELDTQNQSLVLETFMNAVTKMHEAIEGKCDIDIMMDHLGELNTMLQTTNLDQALKAWGPKMWPTWTNELQALIGDILKFQTQVTVVDWKMGLKLEEQMCFHNCLLKIVGLVEEESSKRAVGACEAGIDLAELLAGWIVPKMKAADCVGADTTLTVITNLKRRQAKWKQQYHDFVNSSEPANAMTQAVATVQAWMLKGETLIDEVLQYHASTAIERCKQAMQALEPIAGGLLEGGSWRHGFKGTFEELAALAETTCIANGPVDLMAGNKAMEEFVVDIAGGSIDGGIAAEYKALKDMATITKCEAILIKLLTSEKDQAKLRHAIQAEVRQFRGIYGKGQEKNLLAPVLWDKDSEDIEVVVSAFRLQRCCSLQKILQ
eukprot:3602448-Amphidinium_carterae.2